MNGEGRRLIGEARKRTIEAEIQGAHAAAFVRARCLAWRVVLGGALPPLLRRSRLVGQGDRPEGSWLCTGPKAAALDPDRGLRHRSSRGRRLPARATGCDRPLDGRPRRAEVPGKPHRPCRRARRLGAAGRRADDHAALPGPPPTQVPQDQPDDEPVADRRDARPCQGDAPEPGDAGGGGQGGPPAAAGRVVPRLSRHGRLRPAPAGCRHQAADAGGRRARGPRLLTARGGAHGEGLWRRPRYLSRPRS
jgi:hypothetical protein